MHYGKKASQQRQCDALGNGLQGNLWSFTLTRTAYLSIDADYVHPFMEMVIYRSIDRSRGFMFLKGRLCSRIFWEFVFFSQNSDIKFRIVPQNYFFSVSYDHGELRLFSELWKKKKKPEPNCFLSPPVALILPCKCGKKHTAFIHSPVHYFSTF